MQRPKLPRSAVARIESTSLLHWSYYRGMSTTATNALSNKRTIGTTLEFRWLRLTFWLVLTASLAANLYASFDARGLYSDAAGYLVTVYAQQWFLLFDTRTIVQILRQAPIVLLSKYTSASLFECGQVFTFAMLSWPPVLCACCWFVAPRDRQAWVVFPLASLLVGFSQPQLHAIGEAAIPAGYYWILLFLLLFRVHSTNTQSLFLVLCLPAFRLHEGAFPLTAILLLALALRIHAAVGHPRERLFVGLASLLLTTIFAYQIRWVIYPQFPNDRESILRGFSHFEFLYVDGHFNLPLVTGIVAILALSSVVLVHMIQPEETAARHARLIAFTWSIFALAAIATAILVEESFSPFAQLQARYNPIVVSAALSTVMLLLIRFQAPDRSWINSTTLFILISLGAAQIVADAAATRRWNTYVADLQSRLLNGRGLIPWETTLHTSNERADINWRLTAIGWVIPFTCIIFAPNGIVSAIINVPEGTTYRPLDPQQTDRLPRLRGIDYSPYERFLAIQKSGRPVVTATVPACRIGRAEPYLSLYRVTS